MMVEQLTQFHQAPSGVPGGANGWLGFLGELTLTSSPDSMSQAPQITLTPSLYVGYMNNAQHSLEHYAQSE